MYATSFSGDEKRLISTTYATSAAAESTSDTRNAAQKLLHFRRIVDELFFDGTNFFLQYTEHG